MTAGNTSWTVAGEGAFRKAGVRSRCQAGTNQERFEIRWPTKRSEGRIGKYRLGSRVLLNDTTEEFSRSVR